jgi:hypothetical protein
MVQHLERGSSHERTSINQADEPQGDLLCLGIGRCYDQLCSTVSNDVMMDEVQNMVKVRTAPVLRVLEQSNEVHDCLAGDAGRILVGVQGTEQGLKMVRQIDPFWNHVEKLDAGSFKCTFCGCEFAAATSISRMKWHLSGVKRRGVKICEKVPEEVQDAARAAIDGPPEKSNKNEAGSGNNEVTNAISAPAKEQNNEVIHLDMAQQEEAFSPVEFERWIDSITDTANEPMMGRCSPEELLHYALETVPRTEMVQHLERGSSHERTSINQADEPQGDSSEPVDLLCLGNERCYDQLYSTVNNDAMMNEVQNMVKVRTAPVLRVLEQSNAVLVGFQGMEQGAGEDRICFHLEAENGMGNTGEGSIQHVDRSFSLGRHTVDAHENRGGATQRIDLVNQSAGFSMEEEDVEDNSGRLVQPGAGTALLEALNTTQVRVEEIQFLLALRS